MSRSPRAVARTAAAPAGAPSRSVPAPCVPPERLVGLPPVVDRGTRLLVLGSFPGVASLAAGQYYAHPRNHFWPLLDALWETDLTTRSYPQRLAALRRRGLGLWDCYASCRRQGSLDQAIEDPEPNDFGLLLRRAPALRWVAHNGAASARAAAALQALGLQTVRLPSTSPANASWSFERKRAAWRAALAAAGLCAP